MRNREGMMPKVRISVDGVMEVDQEMAPEAVRMLLGQAEKQPRVATYDRSKDGLLARFLAYRAEGLSEEAALELMQMPDYPGTYLRQMVTRSS